MRKIRGFAALFLLSLMVLTMSGCSLFTPVDELYCLPQASERYVQLQELVDAELDSGCEYASPTGGNYRQSIQLVDLDGDGGQEALAFFRTAEQGLRICIYTVRGGEFVLTASIAGEGVAIGGVDYADMDGDGILELAVTWQASSSQKILSVYSMKSYKCSVLLTADCTEFYLADLDGDSLSELFTLRMDSPEFGTAEMYTLAPDGEMLSAGSRLSAGITSLQRIRTGTLSDGAPGLFVESYTESGTVVTDIFVSDGESLSNITLSPDGVSLAERAYDVYCSDVNDDGVLDVPYVRTLYSQSEGSTVFRALDWYDYSSGGRAHFCFSTYHCYSDGWYLVLPERLSSSELTVRREDTVYGERAVVLSRYDPDSGSVADLVTIYTLTGENRHDRAEVGGRFVLRQDSTTVYAAKLAAGSDLSREELEDLFNIIYSEWHTGAL